MELSARITHVYTHVEHVRMKRAGLPPIIITSHVTLTLEISQDLGPQLEAIKAAAKTSTKALILVRVMYMYSTVVAFVAAAASSLFLVVGIVGTYACVCVLQQYGY